MNRQQLEALWSETVRSPSVEGFERLAVTVSETYATGDRGLQEHIGNRLRQIGEATAAEAAVTGFNTATAERLIADEMGFDDWRQLVNAVRTGDATSRPLLFNYAVAAMVRGDFSALQSMVGGSDAFDVQIREWYEKGYFESGPETLAEVFSAACMLGHAKTAAYLLDKGVDPYAGMRTGLSGFHYAASSGRLDCIKLLIERKVPMEVKNMYDGTVFDQAIWSAVNEHTAEHASIVEALIEAGAVVEPGYLEWWEEQAVPSAETKVRVGEALRRNRGG